MAPFLYTNPLSPPVRAVLMTAEELSIKMQQKLMDFSTTEEEREEMTRLNPQHTVPTLVDDGVPIWDSHAINAYLVTKYGKNDKLYPKDPIKRAIVDQRLHFDTGSCFPLLSQMVRPMWMGLRYTIPQELIDTTKETYKLLEKFLENKQWVAGNDYTIADFSLLATITSLDILVPIDAAAFPNISAWIKRGEGQPFYVGNKGVIDYRKVLNDFLAKGKK